MRGVGCEALRMVENDAEVADPAGVADHSRGWSGAEPVERERPFPPASLKGV